MRDQVKLITTRDGRETFVGPLQEHLFSISLVLVHFDFDTWLPFRNIELFRLDPTSQSRTP